MSKNKEECTIDVGLDEYGRHYWLKPEDVKGYVQEIITKLTNKKLKLFEVKMSLDYMIETCSKNMSTSNVPYYSIISLEDIKNIRKLLD